MARQRTPEENSQGISNIVENIETNVAAYRSGKFATYRSVATELHTLLCNAGRGKPLLQQVVTEPTLHPIKVKFPSFTLPPTSALPHADKVVMRLPHQMRFSQGSVSLEDLFDESEQLISLNDWLNQKLVMLPTHNEITIRQLLSEIRNQDTGHFDQGIRDTVQGALEVKLAARPYLEKIVIAIGEYAARRGRVLVS